MKIKTKISIMVTACAVVSSLAVGLISVGNSGKFLRQDSSDIVISECTNISDEINAYISSVEQSVDTIADVAVSKLESLESFKTDPDYVTAFSEDISSLLMSAAEHTDGAVTAYIRYNPDFTDPVSGIFLTRNSLKDSFSSVTPTDFSIYDKDDVSHVGWYYIPVNNRKPTWMDPYYNENIGVYMISYVVPIFKDNESIGIIGMDIDFTMICDIADDSDVYKTYLPLITDDSNAVMYSSVYDFGTDIGNASSDISADKLISDMSSGDRSTEIYEIKADGNKKYAAFSSLGNGMKYIFTVDSSEVNAETRTLSTLIIVLSFIVFASAAAVSIIILNRLLRPMGTLSKIADAINSGDLDIGDVKAETNDDLGVLVKSFSKTVYRLRGYIDYINEITEVLNLVADGNLNFELHMNYRGDFAKIKDAFNNISSSLNDTLTEINSASFQVANGSHQVSEGAQTLAQSSSQQAQSVKQLTDMMDMLIEKVTKNNESVAAAFEASRKSGISVEESSRNMIVMTEAMKEIESASNKINDIVETVREIASQTNILAINAAIEAARAGDAGRGFAVVADEIQKLSAETNAATQNITELVGNVIEKVDNGRKIADKAEISLNEVVEYSAVISDRLDEISVAGSKQTEAINAVYDEVRLISGVAVSNNATAEESAAVSEEMNSQANILKERVSKFNLRK